MPNTFRSSLFKFSSFLSRMSGSQSIRILCFGDSLTEGYSNYGTQFTPYSDEMKRKLRHLDEPLITDVVTEGQSGDRVTSGNFKWRMEQRRAYFEVRVLNLIHTDYFGSRLGKHNPQTTLRLGCYPWWNE